MIGLIVTIALVPMNTITLNGPTLASRGHRMTIGQFWAKAPRFTFTKTRKLLLHSQRAPRYTVIAKRIAALPSQVTPRRRALA